MNMEILTKGQQMLATVLKNPKNVEALTKAVYKASADDEEFLDNIYQCFWDIKEGCLLNPLLRNIRAGKLSWSHPSLETVSLRLEEQDGYLEHPFDVEEGAEQCRCGSKRVYSYSIQRRGSDEPPTTYAQCSECKNRWSYSG
jgi:DNA-directed RNA polymerase subunit M/transcription elongation factor TFIIS